MYLRIITLLLLLSLASCGPIYTTEYEIVPPQTEYGSMCANNCVYMKSNCTRSCKDQNDQCYRIKQLEAQNRYLYEEVRRDKLSPVKQRSNIEFYDSTRCDDSSCLRGCTIDYHICHKNCGGDVIAYSRCTAFCN